MPLSEEELGAHLIQCGLGPGLPLHHLDPSSRLARVDMGRKVGEGAVPLVREMDPHLSNTMSPGLRPTSVPSGILINPAVWRSCFPI